MFTKKDLKDGMILKDRRGWFYVVIGNTIISKTWNLLENFYEDLTSKNYKELDIIMVWKINDETKYGFLRRTSSLKDVEDMIKECENNEIELLYEESEIDWSSVKVDTKILSKNRLSDEWLPRHFSSFKNGKVYVFSCGRTSFTECAEFSFKYNKLYEDK